MFEKVRLSFYKFNIIFFIIILVCLTAFTPDDSMHKLAQKTQQTLSAVHAVEPAERKIKKCEITISDEGFLRYRKFYISGKQEYYSFNLAQLKGVEYFGTSVSGNLVIHTLADDVIVQTYNDRACNVDSMSVQLKMSLSGIEAEDLAEMERDMFEMKRRVSLLH